MQEKTADGFDGLIPRLAAAVRLGDVEETTRRIKAVLEEFARDHEGRLPPRYHDCCAESYARRLVHRDPDLDYSVVAMTWGPGQGTELHDHAGMWCVECVMDGHLEVTQYDLVEKMDGRYRFERRSRTRAGIGSAGALIPPFEYHTLTNILPERETITLHVYGGEMNSCNLYRPREAGWWEQISKNLDYTT